MFGRLLTQCVSSTAAFDAKLSTIMGPCIVLDKMLLAVNQLIIIPHCELVC